MSTSTVVSDIQALLARGDLETARARLAVAAAEAPGALETLRAESYVAFAAGEDDAALDAMRRALDVAPEPALRLEYVQLLASVGRRDEAIAAARALVDEAPSVEAAVLLGRLNFEELRDDDASAAFGRALELDDGDVRARRGLAEALFSAERYDAALPHFDRLATQWPADPAIVMRAVQCLARLGDQSAAEARLDEFVRTYGDVPALAMLRGRLAEDRGDADAARAAYDTARNAAPGWIEPIAARLMLDYRAPDASLLATATEAAAAPELAPADRAYLDYALGKVADAAGDAEGAWSRWTTANAARRLGSPDEPADALDRRVAALRATYTRERVEAAREGLRHDPRPVLVVGMPRSGTTLVEAILAAHPDVASAGELPLLAQLHMEVERALADGREPEYGRLAEAYMARLTRNAPADARRIVDKQPYNFMFVGLAAALLPSMHVVWCRRDVRDVAVSIFGESFAAQARYATDLGEIRALHDAQERLMRHWQDALGVPVHEVRYEDLVANPEAASKALVDAVGLEWDLACLAPERAAHTVRTNSRWQVREPIYSRSVGRWRRYASALREAGYAVD